MYLACFPFTSNFFIFIQLVKFFFYFNYMFRFSEKGGLLFISSISLLWLKKTTVFNQSCEYLG